MVFLGFKFLFLHTMQTHSKSADLVEEKLHPHSAFMIGFVRVLGNPAVLLLWITLAGAFSSHDWVENSWSSRASCIAGVGIGAALWFLLLSYLVSLKHKELSPTTLMRMSHISGGFLLVVALAIGVRIVIMLSKHQGSLKL
jgi:threonine/homoserine/homoserine lactone efflux protein